MLTFLNAANWAGYPGSPGSPTCLNVTLAQDSRVTLALILAVVSIVISLLAWSASRRLRRSAADRRSADAAVGPTSPAPGSSAQTATGDLSGAVEPAVIAVIAAAVACMLETSPGKPAAGFIIRKVRRA